MSHLREKNSTEKKLQLSKFTLKSITNCTIDNNIVKIESKIHRVKLSGEKIKGQTLMGVYDFASLKKIFPNAGINPDFIPDDRMPNYDMQIIVDNHIYTLNIFTYRNNTYCPPFCLDVTPKEGVSQSDFHNSLVSLNKLFPRMCVSSVEYAIDIFCDTPSTVEWLFGLLRRALYVPYAKEAILKSEDEATWDEKLKMCVTQHFGGDTKIYPRGNDCDKNDGSGWSYDTLNRVRLEYTPNRNAIVKKSNINTLPDLLRDCLFQAINQNLYHFSRFDGPSTYPEYYEDDWSNYSDGTFQTEYIMRAEMPETKNNYRKYVVEIEDFEPLKEKLIESMATFDSAWGALSNRYII